MMIEDIIFAARKGGEVLEKYFGSALLTEQKSAVTDVRTKADLESEQAILSVLSEKFPDFNIFSEEIGALGKGSDYTIVIDPLDGTNNFVIGIPNFSVSIGVLRDNQCLAGVIHAPLIGQTYSAELGCGAFRNGKRISVSKETSLEKSTVSYTCGYINDPQFEIDLLMRLRSRNVKRYITNWSPAFDYCLLASGKIEAVINNDNDVYDYVAGKIIAQEAGAIITDFQGGAQDDKETSRFIAANNREIHEKLLRIISL